MCNSDDGSTGEVHRSKSVMRRSALVLCLGLIGACTPEAAPTSSFPSATASLPAVPVEHATSVVVLDLGIGPDRPGVTPAGPGGITAQGPTSFAVDEGWIYLWDQANQRLLLYELHPFATNRQLPPTIALPSVPSAALSLLVVGTNEWYLRTRRDDGAVDVQFHVVIREPGRGPMVTSAAGVRPSTRANGRCSSSSACRKANPSRSAATRSVIDTSAQRSRPVPAPMRASNSAGSGTAMER